MVSNRKHIPPIQESKLPIETYRTITVSIKTNTEKKTKHATNRREQITNRDLLGPLQFPLKAIHFPL